MKTYEYNGHIYQSHSKRKLIIRLYHGIKNKEILAKMGKVKQIKEIK